MPVLDVTAVARELGGDAPLLAGVVRVRYWSAPTVPAATVDGTQVRFSPELEVLIVNGVPVAELEVPATDDSCYATITIQPTGPSVDMGRYQSGPVAIPPSATSLADLIPVNPISYAPSPAPSFQQEFVRLLAASFIEDPARPGTFIIGEA
ncbi:hypothetical protein IC744_06665 [Microbacterium hominis]|uniref:hypothetical protein n=1 Tax=Microbacterium TaxID=33882 RepID=UPI00168A665B|nr:MULTISPECIES: hypothetical protein [Microbacterium]QOC26031.1 hypothetical protein IC745_00980 [Microbacterium hominis]QOC30004.1 hypothetical protein IC744_06665 [Microbacterium hominis]QYF98438.1 hypothetical protein KY498_04125 [Microbacterium sp. PAMC21962]